MWVFVLAHLVVVTESFETYFSDDFMFMFILEVIFLL